MLKMHKSHFITVPEAVHSLGRQTANTKHHWVSNYLIITLRKSLPTPYRKKYKFRSYTQYDRIKNQHSDFEKN